MKKGLLYILFIVVCSNAWAQKTISLQETESLFKKVHNFYKNNDYSIKFTMASYKGHKSESPEDVSNGYLHKVKDIVSTYQMGSYSVQNKEMKVVVDSNERIVGITFPDTTNQIGFTHEQLKRSEHYIDKIILEEISGEIKKLVFHFKPNYTYERIELSILPSGLLKEVIMLMGDEINYEDKAGNKKSDKAKVKMTFNKVSTPAKIKYGITDILWKNKTTYSLKSQFKSFELIDFRFNK